ncbi:anthranilate synthase component II [Pleionea mediterranea]|uniref:Anthranilate synthase component II n=1 Tax=Pleionea mediterranea TaxID=523701 RepID=A0A316FYZ3_9GAMM|nr:aminodeoxychorismate/anthranilate synthase component II [Pleionea mediterranea]PWK53758.1 anthranilate synthase component II [Pleionea mediterranea]
MLLMIDNYDSFTFNLVQYFQQLKAEIKVVRNDQASLQQIEQWAPEKIVISPGPCSPDQAGISLSVIGEFAGKIPILGVCLGHQAIAQHYGASIVRADEVMHGKTSDIHHTSTGVFRGLSNPFKATRYHSLVIDNDTLPDCFDVTAWSICQQTGDRNLNKNNKHQTYIMGIKHKTLQLEGVQFHPESILSEHGHQLLQNFLGY